MFFFCLFGQVDMFVLLFGRGACCFCFAVWANVCYFLLFGRGGGSVGVFFWLFGHVSCFFLCLGGGREFTHLLVCLARL